MARPRKTTAPSEFDTLTGQGFTPEEAREIMLSRARGAAGALMINPPRIDNGDGTDRGIRPSPNAQQAQDRAVLGPDPELVKRLETYRQNHPPQPQPETFTVTLDPRRADFVRQKAIVLSHRRNEQIPVERAIALMINAAWQIDPDRLLLTAGATGPRSAFNPATGSYG